MTTLREMIDVSSSLNVNTPVSKKRRQFKAQQEVVIRRPANRSGPVTTEVVVGRILAVGEQTAMVSVNRPGGMTQRVEVRLDELSPVTDSFRRSSIQFSPQYRPKV